MTIYQIFICSFCLFNAKLITNQCHPLKQTDNCYSHKFLFFFLKTTLVWEDSRFNKRNVDSKYYNFKCTNKFVKTHHLLINYSTEMQLCDDGTCKAAVHSSARP